ncbi:hypothetical protein [Streptomyces sp. NBC_01643]|uniref:hypothetical protein n=1 Tax=Streptomyces sp. NBC_01643 TaxID=2975906 RepID=UPI002F9192A6|nr:hypothetical protein OHB03_47435 [Streptomyces sp. NBC_01643]
MHVLTCTPLSRHLNAVGSNRQNARLNVTRLIGGSFVHPGALLGIANFPRVARHGPGDLQEGGATPNLEALLAFLFGATVIRPV